MQAAVSGDDPATAASSGWWLEEQSRNQDEIDRMTAEMQIVAGQKVFRWDPTSIGIRPCPDFLLKPCPEGVPSFQHAEACRAVRRAWIDAVLANSRRNVVEDVVFEDTDGWLERHGWGVKVLPDSGR